jgi:competence protein ComEC
MHTDELKVAHHGSKTSTSPAFLAAVTPKVAVISVGKNNRYGHPTSEALERLGALQIPILRTDQGGTIKFSLWPDRYSYSAVR